MPASADPHAPGDGKGSRRPCVTAVFASVVEGEHIDAIASHFDDAQAFKSLRSGDPSSGRASTSLVEASTAWFRAISAGASAGV